MRIVHVLQWLEVGGGEMLASRLAGAQRDRGDEVSLVALADGPLQQHLRKRGLEVSILAKRPGFDLSLFKRLIQHFRQMQPDVVHTHDPQSLVYAAAPARLSGAHVVNSKHGVTRETARRMALRRAAAKAVHCFVTVSDSTAEAARDQREVDDRKLTVITNGVDMAAFRPDPALRREVRRELGLPDHALVIGTVGRQEPVKDPQLLLRAAAPLLNDETRLLFTGSGSVAPVLEEQRSHLPRPEWVQLLGARDDVGRILNALDIFALTSRTEGLPLVLLEAMACALPVVVTAVGGIPDVITDGVSGLLLPPGDHHAARAALARLRDDSALRTALGAQARTLVEQRYSFTRMLENYDQAYARS